MSFKLEKKLIAQVRYYEVLFKIRDANGETIYTGSEETAKRILKLLNAARARAKDDKTLERVVRAKRDQRNRIETCRRRKVRRLKKTRS